MDKLRGAVRGEHKVTEVENQPVVSPYAGNRGITSDQVRGHDLAFSDQGSIAGTPAPSISSRPAVGGSLSGIGPSSLETATSVGDSVVGKGGAPTEHPSIADRTKSAIAKTAAAVGATSLAARAAPHHDVLSSPSNSAGQSVCDLGFLV